LPRFPIFLENCPAEHTWLMRIDGWLRPEWDRAALVLVDVQVDFVEGGSTPIAGTAAVLPRLGELLAAFRSAGRPIVHVVRLYDGDDVDLVRRTFIGGGGVMVRPGSPGSELAPGLAPAGAPALDPSVLLAGGFQELGPGEWAMWKPRWSAFHRTGLDDFLRRSDVSTVVFAGCNYPNCPRASITSASERDFRVVVAEDAISGVRDWHLTEARGIGAVPLPTGEIAAAIFSRP
jgi:nicotinamidase-related amidase